MHERFWNLRERAVLYHSKEEKGGSIVPNLVYKREDIELYVIQRLGNMKIFTFFTNFGVDPNELLEVVEDQKVVRKSYTRFPKKVLFSIFWRLKIKRTKPVKST